MPGMNKDLITKYLELLIYSNSQRLCCKSSKLLHQEAEDMIQVQQMSSAIRNGMLCYTILLDEAEDTIYSDLTGRLQIELYTGTN